MKNGKPILKKRYKTADYYLWTNSHNYGCRIAKNPYRYLFPISIFGAYSTIGYTRFCQKLKRIWIRKQVFEGIYG